ncbi:Tol-Pal system beta propeller repeat protein TolB [Rhodopseudomonas palustris]|uniref:Tol-Pal system protein TolB n=1 Tax=Thiospirillum jenense TaxID=1653858 RepID=A0A839HB79_9GAMM|nr:Tol-Pal system beta propeller repeat protein TolB [Thiospirillum jenense]MBB1091997.1 Tol-Pal system beta propeller repeat protein TolB [Rhodopseudomonas palustris]MBB1126285.1 Tol-Pal system beta propeller repeat protein TolB [Thiospirillum jenense]
MTRLIIPLLMVLLNGWGVTAEAKLTIDITGGVEGAQPIAVVPFGNTGTVDMAAIIAADLARTGRFQPLARSDMVKTPHTEQEIDFPGWQLLSTTSLVVGRILPGAAGSYQVEFGLFDVFSGKKLLSRTQPSSARGLRLTAHRIADEIYHALTGERGVFAGRIAYITSRGRGAKERVMLRVAEADGHNPQTIVDSADPLMSPAWSPDGRRLAYVSFEGRQASIYVQDLASGRRQRVASHQGINGSPAFSPDGSRLAVTLSKDGNPEIYVISVDGGQMTRITNHPAIDTEPAWSPDGRTLVFTSDRGGQPQIYRTSASGGAAQRVTFEGDYNAAANFSPDGRTLVLVTRVGKQFRIATVSAANGGGRRFLSGGPLDESPSFAPNGSMVVYGSQNGGRGVLVVTPIAGGASQRLTQDGEAREPSWSPVPR